MGQFRSSPENPSTPLSNPADWLYTAFGAERVSSGVRVTPATAMGLSAFWACVKIISETSGSLPLFVFQELDKEGDKEKAKNRPEYRLLHDQFNPAMTAMVARETCQAHILCWGNAYLLIRYNGAAKVDSLWPLHPSKTEATTIAGNLVYETSDTRDGRRVTYAPEDIVHVPGMSFDGIHGMSPVQVHRETIGHGIAAEKYGSEFFSKGETPAGVLEHPTTLTDEAYARLKKDQEARRHNPHGTAIYEEGMTYKVIAIPPEHAQYIETRQFSVADMARIHNIPLSILQVHDKAAAYASVEQFFLQFGNYTMRPWLVRWEQELNRKVLGLGSGLVCEHSLDAILRGDLKSRYDAWHTALTDGWLNKDEVRAKENFNAMPDGQGKVFFVPANTLPLERALKEPAPQNPANPTTTPQPEPPPAQARTEHGLNGKETSEAIQ